MVRRPKVSEKEDHQRGKMDMLNMYIATERLVIVGVVWRSAESWGREAILTLGKFFQKLMFQDARKNIALPSGAAAAASATINVISHFVLLL
jgi:hypothetical protein